MKNLTVVHASRSVRAEKDGRSTQLERNAAIDVLCLVAVSGLVRPKEIERVCLTLCRVCRESREYSVVVKHSNAHILKPVLAGKDGDGSASNNAVRQRSRVTPHRHMSRLRFQLDWGLTDVTWPEGLRVLKFGWRFNSPLGTMLPGSLLELDMGGCFNHHVEDVTWPPGLVKLCFAGRFNRPIELAEFPATLETLILGPSFDQPIESVKWPPAIERLSLGHAFNHPIRATTWGKNARLKKLEFGAAFSQSVDGVAWPLHLEELTFGDCFNGSLDTIDLPRSMKLLRLSDLHDGSPQHLWSGLPKTCELMYDTVLLCDEADHVVLGVMNGQNPSAVADSESLGVLSDAHLPRHATSLLF